MADPTSGLLYSPNPDAPTSYGGPDVHEAQQPGWTGASWDPLTYLWRSLPANVREAYKSGVQSLAELSPGAAIRDALTEGGEATKGLLQGRWQDAAGHGAGLLTAMAGVIPGDRLIGKTAQEIAQPLARAAGDIRVSTRFPTAVKATEDPLTHHLNIGRDEVVGSETWAGKNQGLLGQWPGFRSAASLRDPTAAADAYVNQASDNLRFIMENAPDVIRKESPHWYEGANEFDNMLARRWGVPEQSVHGMTAVLSPKRDWYQNASLAERTGDILAGITKPMTPEMEQAFRGTPALQRYKTEFDRIKGARLSDLQEPGDKALWVQLYDKAHNPTSFRTMSPTGLLGDWARSGGGKPINIASPTLEQSKKAVEAFQSGGDMNVISPLLGEYHKVRNFYNNLAVPFDRRFGDVTADTHAVAANQFQPLTLKSPAVVQSFGTHLGTKDQPSPVRGYAPWQGPASSSIEGVKGVYGLNVEPYRKVGSEYDLLPRATQSVVWDTVRPLFEQLKASGKGDEAAAIWRAVDSGNLSADEARRRIVELAGGFKDPDWAVRHGLLSGPEPTSSYR